MQARGLLNYRLKHCWLKVICCLYQPNELEWDIKKKLGGGQAGGKAKIWGGHSPPRLPLSIATEHNISTSTVKHSNWLKNMMNTFYNLWLTVI